MPSISFTSPVGPITANVHIEGQVARDVGLTDLGDGLVALDLGGVEVGARIIGELAVIHALIVDADALLARLRGRR